jgi:hypothetical protein
MVELYNDYDLMNSINGGKLWEDLADLIKWQKDNADVLMDAHWVGGDPWTGSKAEVYGWASWNGEKATLALRNGSNNAQTFTTTLRQVFEIPANITGSIKLSKAFIDQANLQGITNGEAINIDEELKLRLAGSSVYMFNGKMSESNTTGIESMVEEKVQVGPSVSYDLNGRRVVNPTKGLYIINGQKQIVR